MLTLDALGLLKKKKKAKTESNSPPVPSTSTVTDKLAKPSTAAPVPEAKTEATKTVVIA